MLARSIPLHLQSQSFLTYPYLHHSPTQSPSPSSQNSYLSSMPTVTQQLPHPTVRVHQSPPVPGQQSSNTDSSMLAQSAFLGSGWGNEYYVNSLPRRQYHKRASSGSSFASTDPPSPLDRTSTFPQIAASDSPTFSPSAYEIDYISTPPTRHTTKSLPTPVNTPTTSSFMSGGYHNAGAQDANGYSAGMRRLQSASGDDEYAFSGQSVSSMSHNSPATPHTNYEVEFDDSKLYHGFPTSSAFNQAMQDVFPDQMYTQGTPSFNAQPQQAIQRFNHLLPHRSLLANRLQVANQDHMSQRTSSPITSIPRDRSPFRQNSPFVDHMQIKQRPDQQVNVLQARPKEAPKSVSPKELMLDDHESENGESTPLFPQQSNPLFSGRRESSNLSSFQFTPSFTQTPSVQIPQQYPFVRSQSRQESNVRHTTEQTPDFPAHLASMESTIEEGPSEPSSEQSVQRPEDTSSDSGTYTCTYHGCTLRFESPIKLQKHKREAHRQTSPTSSPSQSAALRNSQAGPHRCDRINPSTGKPCNSIFSRPYDLTRHEDTIHNARKQKVRCHLCTEEKTFSRNDALTRHMRVVHPDVDWPGKTRRKTGRD